MSHATPNRPDSVLHARPEHAGVVLVDWMIGNFCNYACSYCPSGLHDGSEGWQSASNVTGFFDVLHHHYVDRLDRRVWLQFTGGEPTMHPKIIPILDAAARKGFAVSLISNGSRTRRFWERVGPYLDSVILTYHHEAVDHAHFLSVAGFLSEHMPVHINVTMPTDRFDAVFDAARDLGRACPDATISLKPLRVGFGTEVYGYTPDQLRSMETRLTHPDRDVETTPRGTMVAIYGTRAEPMRSNEFLLRDRNRWQGYHCEAGLESLRITGDGRVFRAVCGSGGVIGRLGAPIDLPLMPVVCDRTACACVADILITKRRSNAATSEAREPPGSPGER